MRVVIAGGHGKIALQLEKLLAANGDDAVGIIRNPEQAADLRDVSAEPAVLDLESADVAAVAEVLSGADVAVFAAGAGPGSGTARKETVDRAAAALFAEAAERAGVRRHLQVSAMGLDRADEEGMDETFAVYLRAKAAAEEDLRARDLDWTILRPGRLTDEPGSGAVHLAEDVPAGAVSRQDVAAVLAELVADESITVRRTLELTSGNTPIEEALSRL
ncbi:NAD(P)H-binding [Amycolatopsis marina]|uniref:NAD(P)H-binding n=1 Tax=Amycolatopsis marina TaxID=490629 RepID=A0A1I0W1P5_9PSEU|nr:NAD(P)H-binding protein [Amycolatopsis marina]SFA82522.1 NAD(P)H-binding [Amycolatopsis marina]